MELKREAKKVASFTKQHFLLHNMFIQLFFLLASICMVIMI